MGFESRDGGHRAVMTVLVAAAAAVAGWFAFAFPLAIAVGRAFNAGNRPGE